jgi:hypothetical protein
MSLHVVFVNWRDPAHCWDSKIGRMGHEVSRIRPSIMRLVEMKFIQGLLWVKEWGHYK